MNKSILGIAGGARAQKTFYPTPEALAEKTVNGRLWLTAAAETEGETRLFYIGAVNGTVITLAGDGEAGPAMEEVLASLTVE